jgi:hypothetical protein
MSHDQPVEHERLGSMTISWKAPDYLRHEKEADLGSEGATSILHAALTLVSQSVGPTRTTEIVADWLAEQTQPSQTE